VVDLPSFTDRQAGVRAVLPASAAAILVSRPSDIRWLTGFSGSSGLAVLTETSCRLITDGRYADQALAEACVDDVRVVRGTPFTGLRDLPEYADARKGSTTGRYELAFQADHLTVEQAKQLSEMLPEPVESVPVSGLIASLRAVKDDSERAAVGRALRLSERVMDEITDILRPGVTEREVAAEIDYRHRRAGADGPAFDTIAAFGPNAAMPHARPTDAALEEGQCILLDFGCVVDGYRSDITRMMFSGQPSDEFLRAHAAVEQALEAAQEAVRSGMDGHDLDRTARDVLKRHGLAEFFTHSLGHGVGLDIHEAPRVSSTGHSTLEAGAVITIEPGVYLPARFGIRIENMVVIEEGRGRILNSMDTELIRI
jgi:Xaa-Pro aminopeptidase